MNKFVLKKLPTEREIENLRKLIGARLYSVQFIKGQVNRMGLQIDGLCKIIFLQRKENLGANFYIDLWSNTYQSPIVEDEFSLEITTNQFAADGRYSNSGEFVLHGPHSILNVEVTNPMRESSISKIELHGKQIKGKIEGESYFLKNWQFDSYNVKLISQIIFYHSNGALTRIAADRFNRISVGQFIEDEKRIARITSHLEEPIFRID